MPVLEAQKRDIFGKKLSGARQEGRLPAVLYGEKEKESRSFFVDLVAFKKLWQEAGESTIVTLKTPDGERDVLIHDVAFHPVTEQPLHVDFYAVDTTKVTQVKVPIVFESVSPAVKNLGGILVKVMHEIEVEALPRDLPHEIKIDVSSLATFESVIRVKDIRLPVAVKTMANPEDIVVSVSEPKEEEVIETPVDLSAIEVEKKGKEEVAGEGDEAEESKTKGTKETAPPKEKSEKK